jgi:type IV pilus assembly protein PilQ
MTFAGATLPKKLERTLDVSKFDSAVEAISTYSADGMVHVVVDLDGEASPELERVGDTLHWSFAKTTTAKKSKAKSKSKVKTEDIPAPVVGGYGASSGPVTSKSVAQASGKRKQYRGPTINLDFKDADIHNLLRFLANIGRVSIVVPDDVKATVTVRLQKVPWDQALEVILASKGLWYRKDGNLYRVADRKVLDAEDEEEAARIRAAVQAEVPEAEVYTLNYASAQETSEKLAPLLSPKGKIEVDSRTNSLIISDIKAHRRRVKELAARLDTQTPQIMIEARIVEARSTYSRDIGIQWGGSINATQANNSSTGLIWPNNVVLTGGGEDRSTPTAGVAAPSDFAVNLPATVGTGTGGAIGLTLGSVGGTVNLNLRLSAAEDEGTVRIISSPKITVLNNTEAEISQGVSIPISIVSAQGTQTQFEDADLKLKVTPYVSQGDCSIAMDVEVTKNEPDFVNTGARGDPTILRKEVRTRILVADGETTVMGGITTRNTGLSYNKIPVLGDLPVIGWFFKHRRENDDRTELLIFVTPKITNKAYLRCD